MIRELNEPSAAAFAMLGGVDIYFDWAFDEAATHLREALELNRYSVSAHFRYINLLMLTGRLSEALRQLQRIMAIDPLSVSTYKRTGRLFYKMRRFENSIKYLTEALELEPDDFEALLLLGASLTEAGKHDKALAIFQKSFYDHPTMEALSMIGYVYARKGDKMPSFQTIQQIEKSRRESVSHGAKLARIYAALGDHKNAFKCLDQAFEEHDLDLIWLSVDPRWDLLENDGRYKNLLERIGLPAIENVG